MDNLYEIASSQIGIVEISSAPVNGRRRAKFVLHQIFENSSEYQDNGISWSEKYTRNAMSTADGMSITAQFVDSERDVPLGHGLTGVVDGEPVFNDAVMVGYATNPQIENIAINGKTIKVLTVESYLDEFRYPNFIQWLKEQSSTGTVTGSVEIVSPVPGQPIQYENGWQQSGRVPSNYIYSGFAVISIKPADPSAIMLELNSAAANNNPDFSANTARTPELKPNYKEVVVEMNEDLQKEFDAIKAKLAELNTAKEKDEKIVQLNSDLSDLKSKFDDLEAALDKVTGERDDANAQVTECNQKITELETALKESKKQVCANELNSKLAGFTDDDRECAKEMIQQYTDDPSKVEINAIVDKIKAAKYDAVLAKKTTFEQNSFGGRDTIDNIFGNVDDFDSKAVPTGGLY